MKRVTSKIVQFEDYLAIDYTAHPPSGVVSLVAVHPDDPERLHWNGGQSYTTGVEGKHYTVLKRYKLSDFASEDALVLAYYKEFHQQTLTVPEQSGGWIAPDGRFYACEYGGHDGLAYVLSITLFSSFGATYALEERGWLRLLDTGYVFTNRCTQAQLNTLQDIMMVSYGDFKKHINHTIERIKEDE